MKLQWISTVLFLASLTTLFAQTETNAAPKNPRPIFSMFDVWEARADLKAEGYSDDADEDPSVAVNQMEMNFSVPLFMSKRVRLMSGANLDWYRFSFYDVALEDTDTYDISVPFNIAVPMNDQWSLMTIVSPSIHSDLKKVDHNDFKTSFLMLANYTYTPQLSLSAGFAYSRIFGDDEYFPAAGLTWTPTDKWSFQLVFPRPGITYALSKRLKFELGASPAGGKWNIQDPRANRNDGEEYTFEFEGWRLGTGIEYQWTDHWSFLADIGTTLRRSYCIENDDETILDSDVDDTIGVRLGLLCYR